MARRCWHRAAGLAAGLWLQAGALAAWAAEETAPPPLPPAPLGEVGFTGALVKMVGGLAGVLGVMLLIYWLVRRFLPGPAGGILQRGRLRLLGRLSLGQRAQVALVQVDEKVLVLGISPGSVTLLDKQEGPGRDGEAPSAGGGANSAGSEGGGFAQVFKRAARKEGRGS